MKLNGFFGDLYYLRPSHRPPSIEAKLTKRNRLNVFRGLNQNVLVQTIHFTVLFGGFSKISIALPLRDSFDVWWKWTEHTQKAHPSQFSLHLPPLLYRYSPQHESIPNRLYAYGVGDGHGDGDGVILDTVRDGTDLFHSEGSEQPLCKT